MVVGEPQILGQLKAAYAAVVDWLDRNDQYERDRFFAASANLADLEQRSVDYAKAERSYRLAKSTAYLATPGTVAEREAPAEAAINELVQAWWWTDTPLAYTTINQTIDILENFARANTIDIQTDLMDSIPIIAGDQAQLQQVILNLISNAIDAIGKDGTVSVKSRADDSEIRVVIADTGPGIPENMQKKIFDPFFTTKSSGKGTGLGLWISYNIVEKLGGSLSLRSQVGQGAEFTITLPIVRPEKK